MAVSVPTAGPHLTLEKPGTMHALGVARPAAPKSDPGTQFLEALAKQNPANTPLPAGEHADPTYLAVLRGMGYQFNQAVNVANSQMAQVRATYATQAQRLPEQLQQAQEQTDTGLLDRGAFQSGERLVRETRNRVANQEQGQDLLSARAAGLTGAQATLQSSLADLAKQRADAEGELVGRTQAQNNQDKYIAAVRGAASSSGGGGGSVAVSVGGGGAPATPAPATPAGSANQSSAARAQTFGTAQPILGGQQHINDYLASQPVVDYFSGLGANEQNQFVTFVKAQHPDADFAPLVKAVAMKSAGGPQSGPGSANQNARY